MAAARIGALLASDEKAERSQAFAEMRALARGDLDTAAACVEPLIRSVLGVAAVEAREFCEASILLGELYDMDPDASLPIGAAFMRDGNCMVAYGAAHSSAYSAVWDKQPSELTRLDAAVCAAVYVVPTRIWARGAEATFAHAGMEGMDWLSPYSVTDRAASSHSLQPTTEFAITLGKLLLDIGSDPADTAERALQPEAWFALSVLASGKKEVMASLIEAGIIEAAVATMQQHSPISWVSWHPPVGALAAGIGNCGWAMATTNVPTQKLLDGGFVDVAITMMKAFELRGVAKLSEANVVAIDICLLMLCSLDLTAPEAAPIVQQLEAIPSALRFVLAHPLSHFEAVGYQTEVQAAVICALAFGKEESGEFEFTQAIVASVVKTLLCDFSGFVSAFYPALPIYAFRPLLHLCVSDANKGLLVQSAELSTLLREGLFADPDHARSEGGKLAQELDVRVALQCDAAECCLQLALYPPGKALLAEDAALMHALHALADEESGKAFSKDAQKSAHGAIMTIEGPSGLAEPEPELDSAGGVKKGEMARRDGIPQHLMVSYQWDHQVVIERVVRSLQVRGYNVWWDLDCMKGSTMDAMSAAVDNSEVVLYGVSLAYKESANCRLEANYAEKDMIPMMMEKSYNVKGWLGLILGTRLWYPFYDATELDNAAFEARVDAIVREIGERGKPSAKQEPLPASAAAVVAEGVPPPAPAPAPAPVPALAPNPSMATAPAPGRSSVVVTRMASEDRSFTPSVQHQLLSAPSLAAAPQYSGGSGGSGDGGGASLVIVHRELSGLMERQQQMFTTLMAEREEKADRAMQELKADMEREREAAKAVQADMAGQIEALRDEAKRATEKLASEASQPLAHVLDEDQLAALQARLRALDEAQLLTPEEVGALEDYLADYIECRSSLKPTVAQVCVAAEKVKQMVGLSEGLREDGMLARQLRRKFVPAS